MRGSGPAGLHTGAGTPGIYMRGITSGVLAENPKTTTRTKKSAGKKNCKALNQGMAVIKSFYIPGSWPISFYCPPPFFFFLAMQIQSVF